MSHPSDISIKDFTYELPPEKIATHPLADREGSKLLLYKQGTISETVFRNIGDHLPENSLLVFNATKVVKARLRFVNEKQQPIEIFCLEPGLEHTEPYTAMAATASCTWRCLVGHLKRWKEGSLKIEKDGIRLEAVIHEKKDTYVLIGFSWDPAELQFSQILEHFGNVPIPPYLGRESQQIDDERYQTVYAQREGSVAAPTAGLHFTPAILKELGERSVKQMTVTLHVGAGTFKPVKAERLKEHEMHSEWIDVSRVDIRTLLDAQRQVIAVGTTSLRTLETLYWMGLKAFLHKDATLQELELKQWDVYDPNIEDISVEKSLQALLDWMESKSMERLVCQTQILIAPPYELKMAGGLITNFHQPQSTLLLLVASVIGPKWRDVYNYALDHNFRFLSYGDSSLLLK